MVIDEQRIQPGEERSLLPAALAVISRTRASWRAEPTRSESAVPAHARAGIVPIGKSARASSRGLPGPDT